MRERALKTAQRKSEREREKEERILIAVVEVCRLPSAPLATTSAAVTAAAPKVRRNEISQKDPRFVASAHVTTTVRPIEKRVGGREGGRSATWGVRIVVDVWVCLRFCAHIFFDAHEVLINSSGGALYYLFSSVAFCLFLVISLSSSSFRTQDKNFRFSVLWLFHLFRSFNF